MIVNEQSTRFTIDIIAAKVAEMLSCETGKPPTDALREFMATKTYQLLLNPKSFLFLESPAYIMDMITAEQAGDWETWLEI
ncbi:MAG: DNA-directed RNA polymerase subunit omega [Clostridiales Family XIII bacterium]|nr:DNA-directed RNA polymerase subunit omega [Clostridiales Family XIII bacterium]